jgi:hypothetical protein
MIGTLLLVGWALAFGWGCYRLARRAKRAGGRPL